MDYRGLSLGEVKHRNSVHPRIAQSAVTAPQERLVVIGWTTCRSCGAVTADCAIRGCTEFCCLSSPRDSPYAWTSCTSQVDIIHHRTDFFHFMRHHSCRPRESPGAPHHSQWSLTVTGRPQPSTAVPHRPAQRGPSCP